MSNVELDEFYYGEKEKGGGWRNQQFSVSVPRLVSVEC